MKDLEDAQYVLGIQIVRNRKNRILAMSQASYIDKMLSKNKMQNSKKDLLLYRYRIHLSKEQCPKTPQEVEDMIEKNSLCFRCWKFDVCNVMYQT